MADAAVLLKKLGFSDKEIAVYCAVLAYGPSPVRKLADASGVNRGTTYDILKSLMEQGLVSYYHQKTKQYFVAEHPDKLLAMIDAKTAALAVAKDEVRAALPELASLFSKASEKPVVKYYEGSAGIRTLLADVLDTIAALPEVDRAYIVYSSADIRSHLYRSFPGFTAERIRRNIRVRAIAIGSGGDEQALAERRWLTKKEGAPTYMIVYEGKTALFSVGAGGEPRGVLIEDVDTSATQRLIFDSLWKTLAV